MYLKWKGNKKFCAGFPYRLLEYNRLLWFKDKLGLNKLDLKKLDPVWLDEIYAVGKGSDRAKEQANLGDGSTQGQVTIKGNIMTKKLL